MEPSVGSQKYRIDSMSHQEPQGAAGYLHVSENYNLICLEREYRCNCAVQMSKLQRLSFFLELAVFRNDINRGHSSAPLQNIYDT